MSKRQKTNNNRGMFDNLNCCLLFAICNKRSLIPVFVNFFCICLQALAYVRKHMLAFAYVRICSQVFYISDYLVCI